MFHQFTQAFALTAVMALPLGAAADTFSGKLNGHNCAHDGHSCPTDKLDPHLAYEPDFVLMQPGGKYLVMPNVKRDIKVRHVLEDVRISGSLNPKYNTVMVDEFWVKRGGDYKLVWSQEIENQHLAELYSEGSFSERPRY